MKIFARLARKIQIYLFVLILAANMPLAVMAEEVTVDVLPPAEETVVPAPEGEPTTTYTYDSSTGRWNTDKWYYDSTTGTYVAVEPPVSAEPELVLPPEQTLGTNPVDGATLAQPLVIDPNDADGTITSDTESTKNIDVNNQSTIDNTVDSLAQSGDATVISNTLAADAISGDASAVATILNNVNSVTSLSDNQKAANFTADVLGDVDGDILLQPMMLKAMLEAGSNTASSTTANITNDSTLTNNIDLQALTGNAGVIGNTRAGDAESGSANTVANVVNIINSMVAANESFIGTVNIYGNLNGDILIAPDFIPQMIANNGVSVESDTSKSLTIDSDDMQSIINNVSLAAESGRAVVADNTNAGNAISGDADTNVVIFNLSGHEIIASNSLLVFVNVLGKWVGVIVDAPEGATAAAIGNGVTSDLSISPDLTIVSNNTSQITNNINLTSMSGNATVAANTNAGNAISGDATASANIANIMGTQFSLGGWFGILFINVFGSWHGSFGVDTEYGNPADNSSGVVNDTPRVIEFIPSSTSKKDIPTATLISQNTNGQFIAANLQENSINEAAVLGEMASSDNSPVITAATRTAAAGFNWVLLIGSMLLVVISAAGMNQIRLSRRTSL